jgi:hypothetical protein
MMFGASYSIGLFGFERFTFVGDLRIELALLSLSDLTFGTKIFGDVFATTSACCSVDAGSGDGLRTKGSI